MIQMRIISGDSQPERQPVRFSTIAGWLEVAGQLYKRRAWGIVKPFLQSVCYPIGARL